MSRQCECGLGAHGGARRLAGQLDEPFLHGDLAIAQGRSMVAVLRVLVAPAIVSATHAGGVTQVEFQSIVGLIYFLEYKDRLEDPTWTPLGSIAGTGAILMLADPAATTPMRFYRVRVE